MGPTSSPLVRPRAARRGLVAVLGAATFGLAACGSDDASTPSPEAPPATATSAPATTAAPSTPAPSSTPSATASVEPNAEALVAAGRTAAAEVSGSSVVAIETGRSGGRTVWEVQLVTRDGDEQDLDVSADGDDVVRTERAERQDAEDRRENRALVDGADLDLADAVDALPSSVDGGTIEQLELDTEGSRTVWDAEVRDTGGVQHEIRIDASSGDVVSDRT